VIVAALWNADGDWVIGISLFEAKGNNSS